jgi:DNA-binding transcriptional MerR regulator
MFSPREVADRTGVSPDTLRHYERKGLLRIPARTAAGYRQYPADVVERVQLIQRALAIGFSLDELARVLRERERGVPPCKDVRDLVAERLTELEERIEELSALRSELRALLADWEERLRRTKDGQPAHLLEALGERPAIERERTRRKTVHRRNFKKRPGRS